MNSNTNNIEALRQALFAQMNNLVDPNCNLEKEIKRTEALVSVSEQIVDTGKLEVQFLQVTKQTTGTGFVTISTSNQLGDGK